MDRTTKKNEVRLVGRLSPEVNIKSLCLCGGKPDSPTDYVCNEHICLALDVMVEISFKQLKNFLTQVDKIEGMGWAKKEKRKWELILREVSKKGEGE